MRCVVLDAMGVIYSAADDVAELLIPFVRASGGTVDAEGIKFTPSTTHYVPHYSSKYRSAEDGRDHA